MRFSAILDLLLVAWFMLFAAAEFAAARGRSSTEKGGDARLVTNFGLGMLVLGANSLVPAAKIGSSLSPWAGSGLATLFGWPWLVTLVALIVVDSLATYWSHRMMHSVPWLWRVHRVHHADTVLDISTSLRNHPLELLVSVPISAAVILAVGAPPSAVICAQAIAVAAAIWQHADLDNPAIERLLAPILITPGIHRIHHSPERRRHDSNYGELFSVWDRVFGTFNGSQGRGAVGLRGRVAHSSSLIGQIFSPVYST